MWTAGIFVLFLKTGYLLTARAANPLVENRTYEDIEILDEEQ